MEIFAGGLMINVEEFVLANAAPALVAPDRATRYGVGVTMLFAGFAGDTTMVVLRELPNTVTRAVTFASMAGPAAGGFGCSVTCTAVRSIVPAGNPVPVRFTGVTSGSAVVGEVVAGRVIGACANNWPSGKSKRTTTIVKKEATERWNEGNIERLLI
jgi:hypothetical protein